MDRYKKVDDIFKKAIELGSNKTTIVFLLATMNDKALTKFHKEFMEKTKDNG